MPSITFRRVFRLSDVLNGMNRVMVTVGPSKEALVLAGRPPGLGEEEAEPPALSPLGAAGPFNLRILHRTDHLWRHTDIPNSSERFCLVPPLPEGRYVVVRLLGGMELSWNALVLHEYGAVVATFRIGAGLRDLQAGESGEIWAGLDDIGVQQDEGLGYQGLVSLAASGEVLIKYNEVARRQSVPPVDDCYALNVASDTETWLYYYSYYSAFCLVRLRTKRIDRVWPSIPIQSARAFAVAPSQALFFRPSYRDVVTEALYLMNLDGGTVEEFEAVDDDGLRCMPGAASGAGRGSTWRRTTSYTLPTSGRWTSGRPVRILQRPLSAPTTRQGLAMPRTYEGQPMREPTATSEASLDFCL